MKEVKINNIAAVNVPALDKALRDVLGATVFGVSYNGEEVTVHLADSATTAQLGQARSIALAHDPTQLTPDQQAEAARKVKLEQTRSDFGAADIDLAAYGSQPALIQKMAQKIAWLEQEITELRGGQKG